MVVGRPKSDSLQPELIPVAAGRTGDGPQNFVKYGYAEIAQLVEHRSEKPGVEGSIPSLGKFC